MELRIKKLEEFAEAAREEFRAIDIRLARIETRIEGLATKADLAELNANLIKWIVGTVLAAGAVAISVMTFVLNNAVPKTAATPVATAPLVINIPPAPALAPLPPAR